MTQTERNLRRWFAAVLVGLAAVPAPAAAQAVVTGNLDLAYRRDIAQDAGEMDSDINHSLKGLSAFNRVRLRLFVDAEVSERVAVLTTALYDQNLGHFDLEGAYVLFTEVGGRESLSVQVGRVAMAFGRFAPRTYATTNPLMGTPLIYQYFSSVRGNRVPEDAAQQLAWRSSNTAAYQTRGLPTLYDACWSDGIQVFGSTRHFAWAASVVTGSLSNPGAASNDGFQWIGRIGAQPTMGLQLGVSAGWGPYLSASAATTPAFPAGRDVEDYKQLAVGVDAAYGSGRMQLTAEAMHNRWDVPNLADGDEVLANTGGYMEADVSLRPGLHWAARLGTMVYADIDDGSGRRVAWDWDVTRLETGPQYYLTPDARLKAVVQLNWRDGAPDGADHMLGLQLATRF